MHRFRPFSIVAVCVLLLGLNVQNAHSSGCDADEVVDLAKSGFTRSQILELCGGSLPVSATDTTIDGTYRFRAAWTGDMKINTTETTISGNYAQGSFEGEFVSENEAKGSYTNRVSGNTGQFKFVFKNGTVEAQYKIDGRNEGWVDWGTGTKIR